MPDSKVRLLGGGNTYIAAGDQGGATKPMEFLARAEDRPGTATTSAKDITPVGYKRPAEVVPPQVQSSGTLTCTVWQLWGYEAIATAFANTSTLGDQTDVNTLVNLYEIFDAQRKAGNNILIKKFERAGNGANDNAWRVKTYENAVITNVVQSETFDSNAMDNQVQIEVKYTHITLSSLTVADKDTAGGLVS